MYFGRRLVMIESRIRFFRIDQVNIFSAGFLFSCFSVGFLCDYISEIYVVVWGFMILDHSEL